MVRAAVNPQSRTDVGNSLGGFDQIVGLRVHKQAESTNARIVDKGNTNNARTRYSCGTSGSGLTEQISTV